MREVQARQLGRIVATARKKKRWSLRKLEVETGIPHSWLAELERGIYQSPAPDRIALIAHVLAMPIKQIDRLMDGSLAMQISDWRVGIRVEYDLTETEVQRVEDLALAMMRQHEREDDQTNAA